MQSFKVTGPSLINKILNKCKGTLTRVEVVCSFGMLTSAEYICGDESTVCWTDWLE